jgi:hypothetical protein
MERARMAALGADEKDGWIIHSPCFRHDSAFHTTAAEKNADSFQHWRISSFMEIRNKDRDRRERIPPARISFH